jgi:hypothetical protein
MKLCEWCEERPAVDPHHCIEGRDQNKPELNDPINIGDVCRECHAKWIGTGGREVRESWWNIKVRQYGDQVMRDWYVGLSLKCKERF